MFLWQLFCIICFCMPVGVLTSFQVSECLVQIPSKEKLQADFTRENLSDVIQATDLIDAVAGKTMCDVDLINVGIRLQLKYENRRTDQNRRSIFAKEDQRKFYAILFQNNLKLFKSLQDQNIV